MFKIIEAKVKSGVCCAYRCKNKTTGTDKFCPKHRHRYRKIKNPVLYTYNSLKVNARRRGKMFYLTFAEFRAFCSNTGYMDSKGTKSSSMSIDRIDASRAYCLCNIQILTLHENGYKGSQEKAPF